MSEWFWNGFYATLGYAAAGGLMVIFVLIAVGLVAVVGWAVRRIKP